MIALNIEFQQLQGAKTKRKMLIFCSSEWPDEYQKESTVREKIHKSLKMRTLLTSH